MRLHGLGAYDSSVATSRLLRPAATNSATLASAAVMPLAPTDAARRSPTRSSSALTDSAHSSAPEPLEDAQRLLSYVMAFRASGFRTSAELGSPDLASMNFLDQLGALGAGPIERVAD
jgi:hypothetical protein